MIVSLQFKDLALLIKVTLGANEWYQLNDPYEYLVTPGHNNKSIDLETTTS